MADISDVENALTTIIADAIFGIPNSYLPGSASSTTNGQIVRLYRGWPNQAALNNDLTNNISNISVYPMPGMARDTTRHELKWTIASQTPITLTANVEGNVVTFGGSGGAGQVAGIGFGISGYSHRLTVSDNPSTVATSIAALIQGATASGATVTLPTTRIVTANVVSDVQTYVELKRQEQVFRIVLWCVTPSARDQLGSMISGAMGMVRAIPMPDGSKTGIPHPAGTHLDDVPEIANLWRRDLLYRIEYCTTYVETLPETLFVGGPLNTGMFGQS